MHDGELGISDEVAAGLISRRFPELAGRPLRRLRTAGTVNTIIRVGDAHAARFPLVGESEDRLHGEAAATAEFAAVSPITAPITIGVAPASEEFPSAWTVQTWVAGDVVAPDSQTTSVRFARDLVDLISSVRTADVRGRVFDGRGRGGRLRDHDEWVEHCLAQSAHLLDVERAGRLWRTLRDLPTAGPDVMSHRDLTPFNLLASGDRLAGVLDTGGFGPADPALDLVAAWHLFDEERRSIVRDGLGADAVTWRRGAAWALQQAMGLVWYYEQTNPAMSELGLSTMRRLLADEELCSLD
ncbi:phosphotransferase [Microbacterium sp. NPDC089695]|uniref:phosphotransferase n=1 Tax=Microbacterium sp. NPDC089695 TaxID=3364198 RepID=UPI003830EFDF